MSLDISFRKDLNVSLAKFEGRCNFLYLDGDGGVTVGIGHLVPEKKDVDDIILYAVKDNTTKKASLNEKQEEYNQIAKLKPNNSAVWYRQFSTLIMKDDEIDNLFNCDIDGFYKELGIIYKSEKGFKSPFDNFPQQVQKALFDMIFSLGARALETTFVRFNAAIKVENWRESAAQSHRLGVSEARNEFVHALFLDAVEKVHDRNEG